MDPITSLTAGQAFSVSILGIAIVFFVLVALMVVIGILRSVVNSMDASRAAKTAAAAPVSAVPAAAPAKPAGPPPGMVPAKGSLGEIKLHNVDDKTAALIMAIVADGMQAPLNELRFISIREK